MGSREKKERKKDGMGPKSRAARIKRKRARHHHAPRCMMPREFPATRQSDSSSHEPLPRTPSDLLQPLECQFRPRKDWHANRDKPHGNRNKVQERRKSERVKIESFVLCPTFLVPRNSKHRRGNCHNPIFTSGIFSGVSTQNETARTKPA